MTSGIYDADGLIRLTASPGSGFCGRYAPDGSLYFTAAPGSGFCGSTAPNGSIYVVDATGSTTYGLYAANGAIRVTTNKTEFNGSLRVSGFFSSIAAWDATTNSLANLLTSVSTSRTSLATMFDSTGKLTYAPNNLLTYSNTFSNAAWASLNGGTGTAPTITSGQTDPLGGSGAWRLLASRGASNTTSDYSLLYQDSSSGKSGTDYSSGIWIKSNTGSPQTVTFYINSTGAVSSTTTVAASIAWTFVSAAKITADGTALGFKIGARGGSYGGDATIDVLIYSAVSAAVTYETTPRTADQVITTASAYYGPRVDYDPNTLAVKGLLIEENRTWVALWNRDFTKAAWTKTSVTAALDQVGIDGVANSASSLTASANNGTVLQAITLASSQRATSAYVKRLVGSGAVSMTTDGGTTWTDITSQLGAGAYARATIPAQTVTNPSVGFKFATSGDKIAVDFFGNENGAFQTSPLVVASASVTRAADALTAASLTTYPAIIQKRDLVTGVRSRVVINPWSGISSEVDEWIEAIRIYPLGTTGAYLNTKLTVDGPW